MRVSVRLKGFWASALVASLAVVQAPSAARAQNEFVPNEVQTPATAPAAAPDQTTASTSPDKVAMEAKRLLLNGRHALAKGDLATATTMAQAAEKLTVNFERLGDSPATILSLVERQNQLVELAGQRDPGYNAGAAGFYLTQAKALIQYGDLENAEALIKQARLFPVEFNEQTGDPAALEAMITRARAQATPGKAQVDMLMSKAQLAFDRGQYNEASALVEDAKKLNVPASEFAASDIQPWQLELKIQGALSKVQYDPAVTPTQMVADAGEGVAQAGYDPNSDTTKNVTVSGKEDVDLETVDNRFAKIPTTGIELYQAGLEAKRAGKMTEARQYLARAWENREQLDAATQQSVQDQLSRLNIQDKSIELASQNQEIQAADDAVFRALQKEVLAERSEAERLLQTSPRKALEKFAMIQGRIGQAQIDARQQRYLLTVIERDIDKVQQYIDDNLSMIENAENNDERRDAVEMRRQRRMDVEDQMQKLVEQYNNLVDEQRFAEAEVIALQAYDLDPDSEIASVLKTKAMMLKRDFINKQMAEESERGVWNALLAVQDANRAMQNTKRGWEFDNAEEFIRKGELRAKRAAEGEYDSPAEARIWNALKNEQVQGTYRGTLAEAVDQLSRQAGINILFDEVALAAENIRTDASVSLTLHTPVSLESALKNMIGQRGLVFVVENEVVKVTSKESQQQNVEVETYYIGDLVFPMAPPQSAYEMDFLQPQMVGAMGGSMNVPSASVPTAGSQIAMAQQLGGGLPGNPFGGVSYTGGDRGPQMGQPTYARVGQRTQGGVTLQDFTPLINLIQNTIATDSWDGNGQGLGQIQPYVSNLSLVISNTQEVQDEIQDLLTKLRELNDVQIVVEVRFVTLQDNFFERVGIDFDFSINDNTGITNPTADERPSSGVVGQQPIDTTPFTPTSDLDIQFLQGNFAAAEPLFGGFSAASAASFGFAILSDIEVFFLLQASKGNTRTSITQAPTVTMFNGQSANVTDAAQRPFVTSVVPVVGDFAVAHQPIITLLPDGTNLNVTAVVSADRKYVRMQLVPFFSQVTEVTEFTFDGRTEVQRSTNSVLDDLLDIVDGGANADASDDELQTVTQGITVQLPVLATTSVSTVVSVPDGGTVLMGGIKRMREGRTESGVPFLSNIPYVNRLFKNVGTGHETQHLMMMVTPRIIIQKEIEDELVGAAN